MPLNKETKKKIKLKFTVKKFLNLMGTFKIQFYKLSHSLIHFFKTNFSLR